MSCIAQNVPAEVIHQIFALFSATLRTVDPTAFPWFLGHICSKWRFIFLSMTQFWHTISISFQEVGSRWQPDIELAKNITQFFLEQNSTAPFSFTFEVLNAFSLRRWERENVRRILKMLANESKRWKDVSFWVDSSTFSPLPRTKDRLPLLRTLHMNLIPPVDVRNLGQLNAMSESAPSLSIISLPKLVRANLAWSNFKDLTLGSDSSDFYTALPKMTNLERLRIRFRVTQPIHSNDIVYLPRLITLRCDLALLQILKAPALEDLAIDCISQPRDMVLPFLHRSRCNILRLQISLGEAPMAIEIIQHTPQISQLKLENIYGLDHVVRMLIISTTMEHEPLARHLLSLHIRGPSSYLYMSGQFIQSPWPRFIISRRSLADDFGCKKLQKLGTSGMTNFGTYELISLCKERGVEYIREEKWD
ncbi:hypothetical protein APHAL10511_008545 [Amanita phalloides]|nr:hypothetical protein APHAL10511_008545 [Amanita phalloides]